MGELIQMDTSKHGSSFKFLIDHRTVFEREAQLFFSESSMLYSFIIHVLSSLIDLYFYISLTIPAILSVSSKNFFVFFMKALDIYYFIDYV